MEEKLNEIAINIAEIKKDLKYHIKRTDALEDMVKPSYRLTLALTYMAKALVPLSVAAGLWLQLKAYLLKP